MRSARHIGAMADAKFITFEGGEGAGKSTQIGLLAEALAAAGIPVRTTREPGGNPGAEQIRELLVTGAAERWDAMPEALLHFAARREHLRGVVRPSLEAGQWVLSDRFADSTLAYQGYGHGLGRAALNRKIPEMLEKVGLEGKGESLLRTFSKGMQQRLGIAQAIIADPEALIFDELNAGLDPVGRHDLRRLLGYGLRGVGGFGGLGGFGRCRLVG